MPVKKTIYLFVRKKTMSILPAAFIERMKKQLPEEEWEAFFAVYEGEHPS